MKALTLGPEKRQISLRLGLRTIRETFRARLGLADYVVLEAEELCVGRQPALRLLRIGRVWVLSFKESITVGHPLDCVLYVFRLHLVADASPG